VLAPDAIPEEGVQIQFTLDVLVDTEVPGAGFTQVIDKLFEANVAVGTDTLIVIEDVAAVDTQPLTVLVTTTVKIPAPDAIGFEDDTFDSVPVAGTVQV
jgi:hypothetical protein